MHAYLFADPAAVQVPSFGVRHGTNVPYVYGTPLLAGPTTPQGIVSANMMDYVISFVTSLDPNDGKGTLRAYSGSCFGRT